MLNATWTVPQNPTNPAGSNAPGWWFGVQTANGAGALIQPILAFGDAGDVYTIFNGVFDWNDQSWYQSDASQVYPGQTIKASVSFDAPSNTYTMYIACVESGWSVTSTKQVQTPQIESVAYFVTEHQPDNCEAYPANGGISFRDILLQVEGKTVFPQWQAKQESPACNSEAVIVDYKTVNFTW